jgi:hypothetical protein
MVISNIQIFDNFKEGLVELWDSYNSLLERELLGRVFPTCVGMNRKIKAINEKWGRCSPHAWG